ncbi:hypothetical protein M758_1G245100 [Ceratodon purpureus]|nr:hypothetical protein M758_1G245100 [Ceratodon purpureus]
MYTQKSEGADYITNLQPERGFCSNRRHRQNERVLHIMRFSKSPAPSASCLFGSTSPTFASPARVNINKSVKVVHDDVNQPVQLHIHVN